MKTQEQIKKFLENEIDDRQLKQIWNNYTDKYNEDDYIYDMDEFDDIMNGRNPSDIADRIFTATLNLATNILVLTAMQILYLVIILTILYL